MLVARYIIVIAGWGVVAALGLADAVGAERRPAVAPYGVISLAAPVSHPGDQQARTPHGSLSKNPAARDAGRIPSRFQRAAAQETKPVSHNEPAADREPATELSLTLEPVDSAETLDVEPEPQSDDEQNDWFEAKEWGAWDGPARTWWELDYLLWKRSTEALPVLVTTEPDGGVLPNATTLFGGDKIGDEVRPGGRLRFGSWLNCDACSGVEGGLLLMGNGSWRYAVDSSTTPTIARPFFNFTDDLQGGFVGQDSLQVALAGTSTGRLEVLGDSNILSADATLRRVLSETHRLRVDLLAGYQMARLDESLQINSLTFIGGNTTIAISDVFSTQNAFHGGHLGLEVQRKFANCSVDFLGRIAFGNMHQTVEIRGQQTVTVDTDSTTASNGLLAQATNIGRYTRSEFAVSPEIGLHLNYEILCHLNFRVGYTLMYWNRVVQPGDHIDTGINPNQPPPANEPQRPAFAFEDGDFLLHGLDLGLLWSY